MERPATETGTAGFAGIGALLQRFQVSDTAAVAAVIGILAIIIVPLSPTVLSLLLALNISFSLVILLIAFYTLRPLDFSTFPSILLLVTLFRLALNVASTKLILQPANVGQGTLKAGPIIAFFGEVVAGSNVIIGFVIFLILVLIQFIVITRGAGRIAEVAARFTLDAMPGKQLSIDQEMNAGLINEDEARRRRQEVMREADFYGAMDGASKFVRGDAIAGIVITMINLVAGIAVGLSTGQGSPAQIAANFTILTIGDGLVTQIPALLVATAAGIVVTKAASDQTLGRNMTRQLGDPTALFVAALTVFLVGLAGATQARGLWVFLFFGTIAVLLWLAAWYTQRERAEIQRAEAMRRMQAKAGEPQRPEPVESLLHVEPMELEIGYGLLPIVDAGQGGDLLERVARIRRQTALELGIVVPPIRIRDNMQLEPRQYVIKMHGLEVARGTLLPDHLLAMSPGDVTEELPGITTTDPTFGLPARWIEQRDRGRAEVAGYHVIEPAAVLATHLIETIRRRGADLLGRQEIRALLDNLRQSEPVIVEEVLDRLQIKVGLIQQVLRNLLRERVPIRNLGRILEAIADNHERAGGNADLLTEFVRTSLAQVLTRLYANAQGQLNVITVDPQYERQFLEGLQRGEAGAAALDPRVVEQFLRELRTAVTEAETSGVEPVLLTSPQVRLFIRRQSEQAFPRLVVLSYNEITADVLVQRVATVRYDRASQEVRSR